ncbi:MAG: hypothetical protein WA160_10620 [Pseudobdellovibrio sp.]
MKTFLFFLLYYANLSAANIQNRPYQQEGFCTKIMDACKTAGFTSGNSKQKNSLYRDCFQLIMKGEAVAGISVLPSDLSACKAKREAHKQKR